MCYPSPICLYLHAIRGTSGLVAHTQHDTERVNSESREFLDLHIRTEGILVLTFFSIHLSKDVANKL